MKAWRFHLDRKGMSNILNEGAVPAMVNAAAASIAAGVTSRAPADAEVVVEPYRTDRGAAAVILKHPQAAGLEAKRGVMTNAAYAIGVTVKRRGR